jgi:hypothetical protein
MRFRWEMLKDFFLLHSKIEGFAALEVHQQTF